MTPTELKDYRHRLLRMARRLGSEIAQLSDEGLRSAGGEASGGLSDVPMHLADLGSHEFEEDLTLDLLNNESQLLAEVNAAWERLERGTFGRCETCHQEIPKPRLKAMPYARYCITCAEKMQPKE